MEEEKEIFFSKRDGKIHVGRRIYTDNYRVAYKDSNSGEVVMYDDVSFLRDIDFESRKFELFKSILSSLCASSLGLDMDTMISKAKYLSEAAIVSYLEE